MRLLGSSRELPEVSWDAAPSVVSNDQAPKLDQEDQGDQEDQEDADNLLHWPEGAGGSPRSTETLELARQGPVRLGPFPVLCSQGSILVAHTPPRFLNFILSFFPAEFYSICYWTGPVLG